MSWKTFTFIFLTVCLFGWFHENHRDYAIEGSYMIQEVCGGRGGEVTKEFFGGTVLNCH